MDVFILLVLIFGGLAFTGWLADQIGEWNEERKSRIRDDVANEVLPNTNITEKLLEEYNNKLTDVGFIKSQGDNWFYKYYLSGGRKSFMSLVGGKCPSCKKGELRVIKGEYGKFLGCSTYPKCKYTKSLKTAKKEDREKSAKTFHKLFRLAYE